MSDRELRDAFDRAAPTYASARPAYPDELFDDLVMITGVVPPGPLLEIGAGPGLATLPLARRGFAITAIELAPDLAAEAGRTLGPFPGVEVITADFDHWDPEGRSYPLVFAANAWHWLDRDTRWARAAAVIADGGQLAIFGAGHAFPHGFDPFFTEIQSVYEKIGAATGVWSPSPPRVDNHALVAEAVGSGHFTAVDQRIYVWAQQYDADGYLALLDTFSNHLVMPSADRALLHDEVRRLLGQRPDGLLTRHWVSQFAVLRRTPTA